MSGRTGGVREDASIVVAEIAAMKAVESFMIAVLWQCASSASKLRVRCFEMAKCQMVSDGEDRVHILQL